MQAPLAGRGVAPVLVRPPARSSGGSCRLPAPCRLQRPTADLTLFSFPAGAALAHAQCVQNPNHPYDDYEETTVDLGACKNCTADGTACAVCWDGFGVASNGTCVSCRR